MTGCDHENWRAGDGHVRLQYQGNSTGPGIAFNFKYTKRQYVKVKARIALEHIHYRYCKESEEEGQEGSKEIEEENVEEEKDGEEEEEEGKEEGKEETEEGEEETKEGDEGEEGSEG